MIPEDPRSLFNDSEDEPEPKPEAEPEYGPDYLNYEPWTWESFGPGEEGFRDLFFAHCADFDARTAEYEAAEAAKEAAEEAKKKNSSLK